MPRLFLWPSTLQLSPDELKAAILLFYGLLDEQQRRLFAGLEYIRVGHGGDTLLGDFLGLDAHTVARQELLTRPQRRVKPQASMVKMAQAKKSPMSHRFPSTEASSRRNSTAPSGRENHHRTIIADEEEVLTAAARTE